MAAQEGVVVRRGSRYKDTRTGYPEAQSKDAGRCAFAFRLRRHRRTGLSAIVLYFSTTAETGSEVWYTRDERARDCKVLHLQRGVLYKSGVYALKVTCLTLGDLYSVFID